MVHRNAGVESPLSCCGRAARSVICPGVGRLFNALIALWLITFSKKGSKQTEKRKQATRSKFAMLHITRRRDATSNTLQ